MTFSPLLFLLMTILHSSRYVSSSWWIKRRAKHFGRRRCFLPILNRAPCGNITYIEPQDNIIDDKTVWNSLGTSNRALAKTAYSWEQLIDICRVKKDLSLHSRSFHDQRNYLLFKRNVLDRYWTSIHDYILCDKFHFERKLVSIDRNHTNAVEVKNVWNISRDIDDNAMIVGYFNEENISDLERGKTTGNRFTTILRAPPGFRFCAYPSLEAWPKGKICKCLAMNDFPYFVASGIEHWCLWKIGGDVTTEDIDEALIMLRYWSKERLTSRTLIDSLSFVNPPNLKSVKAIDHAHILCLWDEHGKLPTQ